jgi:hypothetical protein
MEEQLYDEFGNYIGPEVRDSDDDEEEEEEGEGEHELQEEEHERAQVCNTPGMRRGKSFRRTQASSTLTHSNGAHGYRGARAMDVEGDDVEENRVVLHEDKRCSTQHSASHSGNDMALHFLCTSRYYPEAEEVFAGVRTVVLDEDAQGLEEPIIKPIRTKARVAAVACASNLRYIFIICSELLRIREGNPAAELQYRIPYDANANPFPHSKRSRSGPPASRKDSFHGHTDSVHTCERSLERAYVGSAQRSSLHRHKEGRART